MALHLPKPIDSPVVNLGFIASTGPRSKQKKSETRSLLYMSRREVYEKLSGKEQYEIALAWSSLRLW
jgi:hypothetical protein